MPTRAETVRGYVQGMHANWLSRKRASSMATAAIAGCMPASSCAIATIPDVKSLVAMVPAIIPLLLMLIPAMLAALGVVREKELGSIINFYVTPVTRLEFLLGKQLPYVALGFAQLPAARRLLRVAVFRVPFKGSFLALAVGALLYVTARPAWGLLISAFMQQPDRGASSAPRDHADPGHPVFRADRPGLLAGGRRRADRTDLPDDLLHHDLPRHLLQGAGISTICSRRSAAAGRRSRCCSRSARCSRRNRSADHACSRNILQLGIKELRSLARDPMLLVLIVYAFTLADLYRVRRAHAGDA